MPAQTPLQEYWYLSNILKNYFNFQETFFFFSPPWQPGIDNKTMNNSHSFHAFLNIVATTVRKFNHVAFITFILHISAVTPWSTAVANITCLKSYAKESPVLHQNLILKRPVEIKAQNIKGKRLFHLSRALPCSWFKACLWQIGWSLLFLFA